MTVEKAQQDTHHGTTAARLLLDAFERVHEQVPTTLEDLGIEELLWRPDAEANSIGWLVVRPLT